MRTQAKPFIVQIKKRKRTGGDESPPARSLFGSVAKELAEELAGASRGGGFGRSADGSAALRGEARASALPAGAPSAWPAAAGVSAAPPSAAARVLPDLSRHDRVEPEEEVAKREREPRIRRKRRYTRKATRTASPVPTVIREDVVPAPAPIPASIAPVAESAGEAQKRVHRQRFKWSAWRSRRGKTTATSPAQPPRGQRWKRRLPRAAR